MKNGKPHGDGCLRAAGDLDIFRPLLRFYNASIALVEERLSLLEAERLDFKHDTLYAACAYCRSVGDKSAASAWARA